MRFFSFFCDLKV